MRDYQREFLAFAIGTGVLRFGEFKLKSGRLSPYFFNAGLFNSGRTLARLGWFYAAAIQDADLGFDMVYGPAYKGIPLAVAVSITLAEHHGRDMPYAFNRKEAKTHGEGGAVVGAPLAGRVLIVDDVISAGTSIRESIELIHAHGATPAGVVISLDRQERGLGTQSAIQELERDHALRVISIVTLDDLIEYLNQTPALAAAVQAMYGYRAQYGASRFED